MMRRGSVLITVLIAVSILTVAAVYMFAKSEKVMLLSNELYEKNQGSIYAATAIEALKSLMNYDDSSYDGLDDIWCDIPPVYVNNGVVNISMIALDGKLSINSLKSYNKESAARAESAMEKVFIDNDIDIELLMALKDWVSPPDAVPSSSLVYNRIFDENGAPYTARHGNMQTFAEALLVPEIKKSYNSIIRYITAGASEPKININLADKEIIEAFLPELSTFADEIISLRQEEPFKNKEGVYLIMGREMQSEYQKILPYFDVKSSLFYVKVTVTTNNNTFYYHMLMHRDSGRLSTGRYIEGGSEDYF